MSRCSFDGCSLAAHAKGYCKMHRQQQLRGKQLTPLAPRNGTIPAEDRFWAKVDKSGDCWQWIGTKRPNGYGAFLLDGHLLYAHRYSWQLMHGPIDSGHVIDHICFSRACVNPDHLRSVTSKINGEYVRAGNRKLAASGHRGVYRLGRSTWYAAVVHHGVVHYLGSFSDKEIAATAAAEKRKELFVFPEYQESK